MNIRTAIVILLALTLTSTVCSDTKIHKLLELLSNDSFKVRTQAAYSLGNFSGGQVQDALLSTVKDNHEAVQIAALVSLAKMGDQKALASLRMVKSSDKAVKAQLRRTILLLEERFPEARLPEDWSRINTIVEICSVSNTTAIKRNALTTSMERFLLRHIRSHGGVAITQKDGIEKRRKAVDRYHIKTLAIMATLSSLRKSREDNAVVWRADVAITVLSYPGRSIRAMFTTSAAFKQSDRIYDSSHDHSMQEKAIEEAIRQSGENLAKNLKDF